MAKAGTTGAKTSASHKDGDVVDDATHLEGVARKALKDFVAADADKTQKRVTKALLDRLKANIAAVAPATQAQRGKLSKQTSATASEVAARVALLEAIAKIRDEVKTTFPGDKALGKAFAVGARLDATSTPRLLAAASTILGTVAEDADKKQKAADAGLKAAIFTKLGKLHDALAAAQATQVSALGGTKSVTATKRTAIDAIVSDVAYVRQVAGVVFKGDARLADFASRKPKRAVAKKKSS